MMDVTQTLANNEETNEKGMIRCLGFVVVFGMVK